MNALAKNDQTVRRFNDSLASARADLLKDERADLAAALRNLGVAMQAVAGFVRENRHALSEQHQGAQRRVQDPGQAAGRARRDARGRPDGAGQPVPHLQPDDRHPRHPHQRGREPRPPSVRTRPRSLRAPAPAAVAEERLCDLVQQALPRPAPPLRSVRGDRGQRSVDRSSTSTGRSAGILEVDDDEPPYDRRLRSRLAPRRRPGVRRRPAADRLRLLASTACRCPAAPTWATTPTPSPCSSATCSTWCRSPRSRSTT